VKTKNTIKIIKEITDTITINTRDVMIKKVIIMIEIIIIKIMIEGIVEIEDKTTTTTKEEANK